MCIFQITPLPPCPERATNYNNQWPLPPWWKSKKNHVLKGKSVVHSRWFYSDNGEPSKEKNQIRNGVWCFEKEKCFSLKRSPCIQWVSKKCSVGGLNLTECFKRSATTFEACFRSWVFPHWCQGSWSHLRLFFMH